MAMFPTRKFNDVLGTANRGMPAESGVCTLCRADCRGRCETWLASMAGRQMLYPRDFGDVTAGSANASRAGVSYDSIRIQGYPFGANGTRPELSNRADDCVFPKVRIDTSFGQIPTPVRLPIITGALGSTPIAAKYWESFAIGAALVGYPIILGENVAGTDAAARIENGRVLDAPELDRRIETYLRYYDGYGAMIVQMNVEDTRNGVAEYVIDKHGDTVLLELKWGQGANNIGGEIQVNDIEHARFLKSRGYIIDPDPDHPEVAEACHSGAVKAFARHSRLCYTDLSSYGQVRTAFLGAVGHLRSLGFKRITLKTGAYGMESLAMAIKFASDAKLDLLTIEGAGGGTGMSPWNMMESWGVPSIHLHAKAWEYGQILAVQGQRVVDMAFAGGFAREDHIFKALALGAPFVKLICMGRSLMIPAFLGANIEGALHPERRNILHGNWESLAPSVAAIGATPEEIFAGYYDVRKKVGAQEMKNIPFGAIATWTLADKLAAGLQQLMAGARKFSLASISRDDVFAASRETSRETGLHFMTDALDDRAKRILLS